MINNNSLTRCKMMTKKIAFITKGFTGSVLPLVKNFALKGYEVDIYLFNYICITELEAFDCNYRAKKYGVEEINVKNWSNTYEYFNTKSSIRLFSLKMPRPYSSIPVLFDVIKLIDLPYVIRSCKFINDQKYNFVNIVCGYYSFEYLPFLKRLNSKIIVSLHEVCDHFNPNFNKPSKLLQYLFKNKIDCIIYSDNSLRDILKYKDVNKSKLYRVNFGLFDSYRSIDYVKTFDLPANYILFFGSIVNYKGLRVLCEAIKLINNNVQFVIAGKGDDPSLEELELMKNVTIINRRLSNSELCEVISKSSLVVCPYLTMSQSGIPQTVFTFGKPIVASDLFGFQEIISNGENGLLFKCGDSSSLARCINEFISNDELRKKMYHNVRCFELLHKDYSWNGIADFYVNNFIK